MSFTDYVYDATTGLPQNVFVQPSEISHFQEPLIDNSDPEGGERTPCEDDEGSHRGHQWWGSDQQEGAETIDDGDVSFAELRHSVLWEGENDQNSPSSLPHNASFLPQGDCYWSPRRPRHQPVHEANLKLSTLLADHTLAVRIAKYKYQLPISCPRRPEHYYTEILVNGRRVTFPDVVSRNGAIHVIDRVLNPRHHPHHKGEEGTHHDLLAHIILE